MAELSDGPVIRGVIDEHRVAISADGRTWIRKRVASTGSEPLVAEALAWLLAQTLDIRVPHAAVLVAQPHGETSWLSREIAPVLHWDDRDASDIENIDTLGAVIALDVLTLNHDRHRGNLLVQPLVSGKLQLWAIDSGNAVVGWPGDFVKRHDELPDAEVLPIQHIVNTPIWQGIEISARAAARTINAISEALVADFVGEACAIGAEPEEGLLVRALRHRCRHIVDFTDRYLASLARRAL